MSVAKPRVKLFSAWFCPYAQRAWTALNLLEIPYEKIEALTLVKDPEKSGGVKRTSEGEEKTGDGAPIAKTEGYLKHPRLLELNPKGLVPTMEMLDGELIEKNKVEETTGGKTTEGLAVVESLDGMDFLGRMVSNSKFTNPPLFAEAIWANKNVSSPYYRCLVPQKEEDQKQGWADMQKGLESFVQRTKDRRGWDLENYAIDIVDLAAFPWIHRLFVIEHFRGFVLPKEQSWVSDLEKWLKMMEAHPTIAPTLASREDLNASYARYARGTAKSKVGQAVRDGKEADTV
jgi:glutathione S-transferase